MKKTKLFILLLCLLQLSCNGQNIKEKSQNSSHFKEKRTEIKQKSVLPDYKNLKILSHFIDTTKLVRFYPQIVHFKKDDSLHPNRQVDIVFSGSSSIRKWYTLAKDMPYLNVLNRGFGGSTVPEAIYYADVLFFSSNPKKVVFYSGDNDIAFEHWSIEQVNESYKYFCNVIHAYLPYTKIYLVSLKPSPGRIKYWQKMQKVNAFLKEYSEKHKLCIYINAADFLFDSSGNLKTEYFAKDGVHLNAEGYKIWTKIIYPIIKN